MSKIITNMEKNGEKVSLSTTHNPSDKTFPYETVLVIEGETYHATYSGFGETRKGQHKFIVDDFKSRGYREVAA
ncbi:MAG TPA: hypothetical protein VI968_00785 [archaeon]|nr:hypothetical protein [archaeon]